MSEEHTLNKNTAMIETKKQQLKENRQPIKEET